MRARLGEEEERAESGARWMYLYILSNRICISVRELYICKWYIWQEKFEREMRGELEKAKSGERQIVSKSVIYSYMYNLYLYMYKKEKGERSRKRGERCTYIIAKKRLRICVFFIRIIFSKLLTGLKQLLEITK